MTDHVCRLPDPRVQRPGTEWTCPGCGKWWGVVQGEGWVPLGAWSSHD